MRSPLPTPVVGRGRLATPGHHHDLGWRCVRTRQEAALGLLRFAYTSGYDRTATGRRPEPSLRTCGYVEQTHERVMITKHGHPAAILISPDDLASLEETLDVLWDPYALADIRESEAKLAVASTPRLGQTDLLLEERGAA